MIAIKTPCLVTFTKPAWDPRYPAIKRKMAANQTQIPVLGYKPFEGTDTTRTVSYTHLTLPTTPYV